MLPCSTISSFATHVPESPVYYAQRPANDKRVVQRVHLAKVEEGCSLPSPLYTGHSFRIGAATRAVGRIHQTAGKVVFHDIRMMMMNI